MLNSKHHLYLEQHNADWIFKFQTSTFGYLAAQIQLAAMSSKLQWTEGRNVHKICSLTNSVRFHTDPKTTPLITRKHTSPREGSFPAGRQGQIDHCERTDMWTPKLEICCRRPGLLEQYNRQSVPMIFWMSQINLRLSPSSCIAVTRRNQYPRT